ncbi:uncharacterized protein LOC120110454 [Phoenix dactylifera]|uniref:Uncharacterized protein LOC120110454 n=1 Tax=Phoenix dactylifera TaxID=42345 RepID=A0A8B9ABV7_PHODC|nr:uncharacterized protein LOC120110454 [Phoenix dactylifera]
MAPFPLSQARQEEKQSPFLPTNLMSFQASDTAVGMDPPQPLALAYRDLPLPPALPSCHSNDSKPLTKQLHAVLQTVVEAGVAQLKGVFTTIRGTGYMRCMQRRLRESCQVASSMLMFSFGTGIYLPWNNCTNLSKGSFHLRYRKGVTLERKGQKILSQANI